jgi:hypothetical protein
MPASLLLDVPGTLNKVNFTILGNKKREGGKYILKHNVVGEDSLFEESNLSES